MKNLYLLLLLIAGFSFASAQSTKIYDAYVIENLGGNDNYVKAEKFNGSDLGTLNAASTLYLGGQNKIVKCDGGNVTGGSIYYVIYPQGSRPANPTFTKV